MELKEHEITYGRKVQLDQYEPVNISETVTVGLDETDTIEDVSKDIRGQLRDNVEERILERIMQKKMKDNDEDD